MTNVYKRYLRKAALTTLAMAGMLSVQAQQQPKNIIFLIGDGMGHGCIEVANYYTKGKAKAQRYEHFPVQTWQSTFNARNGKQGKADDLDLEYRSDSAWVDFDWVRRDALTTNSVKNPKYPHSNGPKKYTYRRYTDSAPAGTALATGVRTYDGAINKNVYGADLSTILQHALKVGKKAGTVSSVQLCHATPAAFIAHNRDRNNYAEIAREMFGSKLAVVMGAGHPGYDDNAQPREDETESGKLAAQYQYVGGQSCWEGLLAGSTNLDGQTVADIDGDGQPDAWTLIQTAADFKDIASGKKPAPKRLLGVPQVASTLQCYRDFSYADPYGNEVESLEYNKGVPTLVDMSLAALNTLKNDKGFVVMIEGGAIDWANHMNAAGRMVEEMIDFNNTVDKVIDWVEANGGWEENLVVVTTDHDCGYVVGPDTKGETVNNPVDNPIKNRGAGIMPDFSYNSTHHTNLLVPVYAKGPGAELLKTHESRTDYYRGGYIDNTDIPRTMFSLMEPSVKEIKNLVVMISDGWGYNQMTATNLYEGVEKQSYQNFPVRIPMSTYPGRRGGYKVENALNLYTTGYNSKRAWTEWDYVTKDYTDSAPAASAMASGVKIYDSAINVDINNSNPLTTLPEVATQKGKAAGVVTSVELSHATPAGMGGAHNKNRNAYTEIAEEMLFKGNLSVVIGAGHSHYDNQGKPLSKPVYKWIGEQTWADVVAGKTLSNGHTARDINGDNQPDAWTLVQDKEQFVNMAEGRNLPTRLLGVPRVHETLQAYRANPTIGKSGDLYGDIVFAPDSIPFTPNLPNLGELSLSALNVLNQNKNGFYLMVEGGAIDWCNHANQLGIMIEEQRDFNRAVDQVINWIEKNSSWDETLLVVTTDHECGYLTGPNDKNRTDNSPITNPIIGLGKGKVPAHGYHSGSHTNMLVPFFAKGVGAEKFKDYQNNFDHVYGYYIDNTNLPHLVMNNWLRLPSRESVTTGIASAVPTASQQKPERLYIEQSIVDDQLTVQTPISGTLIVRALSGQTVATQATTGASTTIALSSLPRGLYVVSLGQRSAKFVKK